MLLGIACTAVLGLIAFYQTLAACRSQAAMLLETKVVAEVQKAYDALAKRHQKELEETAALFEAYHLAVLAVRRNDHPAADAILQTAVDKWRKRDV